jgi:hypothetical protein
MDISFGGVSVEFHAARLANWAPRLKCRFASVSMPEGYGGWGKGRR